MSGIIKVNNEEKQEDVEFEITVKFASKVDMMPLIEYMNNGSSVNPPQEALQAIDIVLRNPASLRYFTFLNLFSDPVRILISVVKMFKNNYSHVHIHKFKTPVAIISNSYKKSLKWQILENLESFIYLV